MVVIKRWFIEATWGVFACFAPQFGLKMRCNDRSSTLPKRKKIILTRRDWVRPDRVIWRLILSLTGSARAKMWFLALWVVYIDHWSDHTTFHQSGIVTRHKKGKSLVWKSKKTSDVSFSQWSSPHWPKPNITPAKEDHNKMSHGTCCTYQGW